VLPLEADPEGVRKRQEVVKALTEVAVEDAKKDPASAFNIGFGKTRPELDWVKPTQMGPPPAPKK
jgi:hypothetical protein